MTRKELELSTHARRMAEEFPVSRKLGRCECCGKENIVPVKLEWRAVYHTSDTLLSTGIGLLLALGGHGLVKHKQLSFLTYHAFCSECFARIRLKKFVGEIVNHANFVLLLVSGSILGGVTIFGLFVLTNHPTSSETWRLIIAIGSSTTAIIAWLFLALKFPDWVVPPALHPIAPRPFQLRTVMKL
jgi:hypothetical protein